MPSDLDKFAFQHSISPEIGIHGLPVDNFSYSESGGVNLSRFSIGIDLDESASSNWTNKTSVMLEVCACCYIYQKVMSVCLHVSGLDLILKFELRESLITFFMQHVRPINDDGRSISRDLDGFPVTAR